MRIRFWGTRGSLAKPGPTTLRYGGNTACVEVWTADGTLVVLDCGTGAHGLGLALTASGESPLRGHLLITHTHWDHIQGFPFFVPVLVSGNRFTVYGPSGTDRTLQEALAGQMVYTYFPISLEQLRAELSYRDLAEGTLTLDGVEVQTRFVNHTVPTLAYRISAGGVSVVYCADHEPFSRQIPDLQALEQDGRESAPEDFVHASDREHIAFLEGADLLIHDAQYTAAEYPQKVGWGHSPVGYTVAVAGAAGVKRLALFHHDPSRTDGLLATLEDDCQALAERISPGLAVFAAAEGMEVRLPEVATAAAAETEAADISAAAAGRLDHARVLITEDDPMMAQFICDALEEDGYDLNVARTGAEAVARARAWRPDLVLLDVMLPDMDGFQVAQALRADEATRDLKIVVVTAKAAAADAAAGFAAGVDDYVTKPFMPAVLRARARVWLLRSAAESGAT